MPYTYWKTEKGLVTFAPAADLEDVLKHYAEAEPVKPKFVRRGEMVPMPPEFHDDFKLVMSYFGVPDKGDDMNQHKQFVREYPDMAKAWFAALAADIRTRPECGTTQRIKEKIDAANV